MPYHPFSLILFLSQFGTVSLRKSGTSCLKSFFHLFHLLSLNTVNKSECTKHALAMNVSSWNVALKLGKSILETKYLCVFVHWEQLT